MLEEGLLKIGLGGAALSLLARYVEEIELFNPAYGLVKAQGRDELITKHILDSLAPIHILGDLVKEIKAPSIADVGSGAGLPGIPLAICMGGANFTLIERKGRRAGFLRSAAAVLGLSNVRVEEAEMENLAGGFDLVVFRAYRPLEPPVLKSLLRLVAPRGILAAYKGRRESIAEELALSAKTEEGSRLWKSLSREIIPLAPPFLDEERHLVVIWISKGQSSLPGGIGIGFETQEMGCHRTHGQRGIYFRIPESGL
jgi:16S rRNA (guanine527-N7)-methyltransferase